VSRGAALSILLVCALLEAGGDALARKGMHAVSQTSRFGFYAVAAVVLFAYGWLVNRPPWSFGSLLGIYVVLFFLVAQAASWIFFQERPTVPIIVGGALIISGGLVISAFQ
jgi:drug/metabolite transporter (DMT)-like permease